MKTLSMDVECQGSVPHVRQLLSELANAIAARGHKASVGEPDGNHVAFTAAYSPADEADVKAMVDRVNLHSLRPFGHKATVVEGPTKEPTADSKDAGKPKK